MDGIGREIPDTGNKTSLVKPGGGDDFFFKKSR